MAGEERDNVASCPRACVEGTHFCSGVFDEQTQQCQGDCIACTDAAALSCPPGHFSTGCTATVDASCVSCGDLRPNSRWVDNPRSTCDWECESGWEKVPHLGAGICDICAHNKSCSNYQYTPRVCTGESAQENPKRYCMKCQDPPDNFKTVESVADGRGGCTYDCIFRQFFAAQPPQPPEETCTECMPPTACEDDEFFVPCTRRANSQCLPCTDRANISGVNTEFYVPAGANPDCRTQCKSGHALHPVTQECIECRSLCDAVVGQRPSSMCTSPAERDELPTCVACDDLATQIPAHAHYVERCQWKCDAGFYFHRIAAEPPQCLPCHACAAGEYPSAATCTPDNPALSCKKCPSIPEHAIATSRTSPECPWICSPGYFEVRLKDGTPVKCQAHWILRTSDEDWILDPQTPVTLTTPTPDPALPDPQPTPVEMLPDFPKRRFRTSGGAGRLRRAQIAEFMACTMGCALTQPEQAGVMDWGWCTAYCVLAMPLLAGWLSAP